MLLMATMLAGAFYWNDQLSFGVSLPPSFPRCTGVTDAPDRGVYILLSKTESCPDLNQEGLFDYVERKRIPAVAVIAWYNTMEEFHDSSDLAKAYCPKKNRIYKKAMSYGDVHYCFITQGRKISLRSFAQLHSEQGGEAVNIEFHLNNAQRKYTDEYWRVVENLVLKKP